MIWIIGFSVLMTLSVIFVIWGFFSESRSVGLIFVFALIFFIASLPFAGKYDSEHFVGPHQKCQEANGQWAESYNGRDYCIYPPGY